MSSKNHSATATGAWGRRRNANVLTGLKALAMMAVCPIFVLFLAATIDFHDGSILIATQDATTDGWLQGISTRSAFQINLAIIVYMILQAVLYRYLPGPRHTGQLTPAGHLLEYKTNGLLACFITCGLYGLAVGTGIIKASFIATNWSSFILALNLWGLLVTLAVYLRALFAPTYPQDRICSGQSHLRSLEASKSNCP